MLVATIAAMYLLGTRHGYNNAQLEKIMTKSLEPTGMILLVTACGGVLRYILQNSGLGDVIGNAVANASLPMGRQNQLITPPAKRNRAFPTGNALLYRSLLSVAFGRVRPVGRTLFFYYASSFSARSIRYPTPTWVWIKCGASGHRSSFLRRDAI